jgi:hypothetical protein
MGKPTGNPNGRPTIVTDELIEQTAALVREGHYIETIANALRIGKSSFYMWIDKGTADIEAGNVDSAYARFTDAVKGSEAWAEIDNTREWAKAGAFWAKHATFAERRWPTRWRKRDDESNTPKVLIQIGVRDGDVKLALDGAKVQAQLE